MAKHLQKNIATSLTALAFLVIAISGVLMYFHLYEDYIKDLHEIIGLFFVAIVMYHVYFNFKSMKTHMGTKIFWIGVILLTSISLGFILTTKEGNNPKKAIIMSVLNSPISSSAKLFDKNMISVESKLKSKGIVIEKDDSIDSIAKRYKMSPFKIVELINQR